MAGLTEEEATNWREYVGNAFWNAGLMNGRPTIQPLDPMRGLTYVSPGARIDATKTTDDAVRSLDPSMLTDRGINVRDYNDTIRSDLIFINLLAARKVSVGTVIEIAWAYERRIPTVVVMEPHGNIHEHAMLRELISYRVDTLDRGITVALSVLGVR